MWHGLVHPGEVEILRLSTEEICEGLKCNMLRAVPRSGLFEVYTQYKITSKEDHNFSSLLLLSDTGRGPLQGV